MIERASSAVARNNAISKAQYHMIMEAINAPVLSDCDEEIEVYVVLNRVEDMPLGL